MGRPRKEIDLDSFTKLCSLMCTKEEMAGYFECSEDTIERWCKRELGCTFAVAHKMYSANAKLSLRRAQFRLAENNATMAIFLGKQYLGQKDQQDIQISTSDDETIKEMNDYFKQKRSI